MERYPYEPQPEQSSGLPLQPGEGYLPPNLPNAGGYSPNAPTLPSQYGVPESPFPYTAYQLPDSSPPPGAGVSDWPATGTPSQSPVMAYSQPQPSSPYVVVVPVPVTRGGGFSIAGFVLGLIGALTGIILPCGATFIVLGVIYSILGMRSGERKGLAIAGLVLALVGLGLGIAQLIYGALHPLPFK